MRGVVVSRDIINSAWRGRDDARSVGGGGGGGDQVQLAHVGVVAETQTLGMRQLLRHAVLQRRHKRGSRCREPPACKHADSKARA
jgi:hypothetical protein